MPRSFALGAHFERLIDRQVESGRYGNASEVVRAALRLMEEREERRAVLLGASPVRPAPPGRQEVLALLVGQASELRAAGVAHLSLFGSLARGEAGPGSDIDLAMVPTPELEQCRGLERIGRIEGLREHLAARLGRPVDLVLEPALRPELQAAIERDRVLAF